MYNNSTFVVTNKSIISEVFMRKPYNLLFFLRMAILANVMILKNLKLKRVWTRKQLLYNIAERLNDDSSFSAEIKEN